MKQYLLLLSFCPLFSFAQTIPYRQYKKGEVFTYRLSTEVYRNEKRSATSVSVSKHTVVKEGDLFSELVAFIKKMSYNGKDTVQLDSLAQKVTPYKISLSPKGKVLLPKLTVPEMTGEITDLNTFYVALSPALEAQKLTASQPVVQTDKLRQGNFADSIEILYGTDCLQVSQKLISTGKDVTVVETTFAPPASFCLTPLLDTIAKKTAGQFNNIQFIRKAEGGKVNVFWGVETFVITSKINNRNGQLLEASMLNNLNLRMRYNAAPDLTSYAVELPITIRRVLKLELIQ